MERSDLESEIGRLLSDPNHDRWNTNVLRERIPLAEQEVLVLTGAVKTPESLTPTTDTAEVALDSGVIDITRVTWTDTDGDIFPLEGRSYEDLDFYWPNWRNMSSGKPHTFSFDPSNKNLILVPPPSSAEISSGCLDVWEVQVPDEMTADDDEPFDGNVRMRPYHMSIVHWVVAQCWMDDATPEALAKARFHKSNDISSPGEFEKVIKKINAKYTNPTAIPERIKWRPSGGLRGGRRRFSKSNAFGW